MEKCKFEKAWVGTCKEDVLEGSEFCKEHTGVKCCSCGNPATHECPETGQFVCGAHLCDECEHTTFQNGTNGGIGFNAKTPPEGMKSHCKKSEQIYKPWYMQEESAPKELDENAGEHPATNAAQNADKAGTSGGA